MNDTLEMDLTPPARPPASVRYRNGMAAEFRLMRLRELPMATPKLETPEAAVAFYREHVTKSARYDAEKESLIVMFLNTRRHISGFEFVANGTLDTLLVHPREVFRAALIANASAIIVAHNHPSGDPTPSEADIKVTRDLIRAGQLLKVELMDHVIVGHTAVNPKGYASLRELGYFYT